MKIEFWWLSNKKMTVGVFTNDSLIITEAAPIVRKFIGQKLENLEKWMGVKAYKL